MRDVSSENVFEEVAKYANPTRRTFLLGLLGAAITAPAVVSFFGRSGQALGTQSVSASGGLSEWTGWYDTRYFFDPSANWPADPSANFMCNISANFPYYSANPIRNPSGNFYTDQSGNYNYFEMIYYDASGNNYVVHDITGNAYYEPSANWMCDPSGQLLYNPSGNWTPLSAPQSGNTPTPTTAPSTTVAPTTTTTTPVVTTESTKSTTPKKLPETR